jgi:peptide/nickel transport system permease protein
LLRGELLDVMSMDFVQGLAGKGLTQTQIVVRHGLRNTAGPFVNLVCLQVGWLVGGTLIVETIFSWPGIGDLLYTSVQQRDYPTIGTIVVVIAVAYSILNLAADLAVIALDPRVRIARVQA